MKQYTIYKHPSGKMEPVKNGWSWPAALFTVVWSAVKGLWLVTALALAMHLFVGVYIYPMMASALNVAIFVIFGISGNKWRELDLVSRGYTASSMAYGANPDAALASYLNRP